MNKERLEVLRLEEERELESFFDLIFNVRFIKELIEAQLNQSSDSSFQFKLKSYYLPLTESVSRELSQLCNNIRNNLGLDENEIEFYVSNDPNINCEAIKRAKNSDKDVVIINSGLLERIPPDQLAFVLGHEIGHLYFDHASIKRVFATVYPELDKMPIMLNRLYLYWVNINELSADRIGLLACKNFESALKALLMTASGIRSDYFNLSTEQILSLSEKVIKELDQLKTIHTGTHPGLSIRIKALEAFYNSNLWRLFESGLDIKNDENLENQVLKITSILKVQPFNEEEYSELIFLASSGLIIMKTDKELDDREYSYILNVLSSKISWPIGFLEEIKQKDLTTLLFSSADFICKKSPSKINDLLISLFTLVLRDQKIRDEEVIIFKKIATDCFGLSESQINKLMLEAIRTSFAPLL